MCWFISETILAIVLLLCLDWTSMNLWIFIIFVTSMCCIISQRHWINVFFFPAYTWTWNTVHAAAIMWIEIYFLFLSSSVVIIICLQKRQINILPSWANMIKGHQGIQLMIPNMNWDLDGFIQSNGLKIPLLIPPIKWYHIRQVFQKSC